MTEKIFYESALVVGEGISGDSAANALMRLGTAVRRVPNGNSSIEGDFDVIVVSPGVSCDSKVFDYAKNRKTEIIGEIELGARLWGKRDIIAVTGTNGKTTTCEMIGNIISREKKTTVCGNIGVPFSGEAGGEYDVAVVEISSFQLETAVSFHPKIACITNIACDHLNRHGDMETYANLKLSLAKNQTESDFLVLCEGGILEKYLSDFRPRSEIYYASLFGKTRGAYLEGDSLKFFGENITDKKALSFEGDFNILNALSAICICRLYGVSKDAVADGLRTFTPSAHRLKRIADFRGKTYWDDSKGTNISASLAACGSMRGDTLVIMGGSDKGYDYDEFFSELPKSVKELVLIGETADKIARSATKAGFYKIRRCNSITEAVEFASKTDVVNVLLSPASASFDMFANYKERGDAFIKAVESLRR